MIKKDTLQRFIFEKAPVRGEYIYLEKSFQTIINQHAYPLSVRKLLGEALSVAGLLSAIIKFDGRLTVQFRGQGKLKLLLAQCDNGFHLRGLAKWDGELSYEDLMDSFNQGVLVIMLDSGVNKRYQGIVSWRGNSLVESIEGYFQESEQLATKIWLTVNEKSTAGLLLQIMPGKEKKGSGVMQEIINPNWMRIISLAEKLHENELVKLDYETLLNKLFPEEEIRIFDPVKVTFKCTCSRKRGADAIELLGRKEAEAELASNQVIVVTCDFCNKEYVFDRVDVAKIFDSKHKPSANTQLH